MDLLLARLVHFLWRQQDDRLARDQTALVDGERESRRAHIVGQVDNNETIDVAEREIHRFQLAADILEMLLDGVPAARGAFRTVAGLEQIFGHRVLPDGASRYLRRRQGANAGFNTWLRRTAAETGEERSRPPPPDRLWRPPPHSEPGKNPARSHRAGRGTGGGRCLSATPRRHARRRADENKSSARRRHGAHGRAAGGNTSRGDAFRRAPRRRV